MERPILWPQNLRFESAVYSKHQTFRQTDRPLRRCAGAAAPGGPLAAMMKAKKPLPLRRSGGVP